MDNETECAEERGDPIIMNDDGVVMDNEDEVGTSSKRRRGFSKRDSKLSATLRGLMGEANLRYARGDTENAKKFCFEIMRQVPDAYEPYLTLAHIFENTDKDKYEGYLAIAACLQRHDASLWCRLAEINIEGNRIKEAIRCYSKAIKIEPTAYELHTKRLQLAEQINTELVHVYRKHLARVLPAHKHSEIIELCKTIAKIYHDENLISKAIEALEIPFKRIPQHITADLLNMMLELLLISERYTECLDIFIQFFNFTLEVDIGGVDAQTQDKCIEIVSYQMPNGTPIDIKAKFASCLVALNALPFVEQIIDEINMEDNAENVGDLYLDIVEDLMVHSHHVLALKLLIPLVKTNTYNVPVVWMKYAECLCEADMLEQAEAAYFSVMSMAPDNVEALRPLAMCLIRQGKRKEALEVMTREVGVIDVAVLMEKIKLLQDFEDWPEYWRSVELLLSRHCVQFHDAEQIHAAIHPRKRDRNRKKANGNRDMYGNKVNTEPPLPCIRIPAVDVEYKFVREVLNVTLKLENYAMLEKLVLMNRTSTIFGNYADEIMASAIYACIFNDDKERCFELLRELLHAEPNNPMLWNLANFCVDPVIASNQQKFALRLLDHYPTNHFAQEFNVNTSIISGHYYTAFKYFMSVFRDNRSPYLSFLLGVIILQIYFRSKKQGQLPQLTIVNNLFMNYSFNRSKNAQHEVFYNLGRLYHQLGMFFVAEQYYLKVLETPASAIVQENADTLDLTMEAAYNLHLIYIESGNYNEARNVLRKYVVI